MSPDANWDWDLNSLGRIASLSSRNLDVSIVDAAEELILELRQHTRAELPGKALDPMNRHRRYEDNPPARVHFQVRPSPHFQLLYVDVEETPLL